MEGRQRPDTRRFTHSCGSLQILKSLHQALENRAAKHDARQNEVLLRAVWRVWKAHERGKLLERVRDGRFVKRAWATWMQRLQEQRKREGTVHSFYPGEASH